MNFYRSHWYDIGFWIFVGLSFYMGFWGVYQFSKIQIILLFSFMALLIHQFEEYSLPGGAPVVINRVLYGEKEKYDRFPGNKQSSMLVNVSAYVFYLLPVFFPNLIWLGLAQMFFGFFQLLGHGVVMNLRMKRWYNPGLLAVIFLHVPLGIYYIYYITQNRLATGWDYLWGIVTMFVGILITTALPILALKNPESSYPFTQEEVSRFNVPEKMKEKGL